MDPAEFELKIPSSPEFVSTARLFVAAAAYQLRVDEETVEDLRVAVSEACTGAIKANQTSGTSSPIVIRLRSGGRLEVEISAEGSDPSAPGEWDPSTPTHEFQQVLGVGLVHALFEDVSWVNDPTSGMKVSFSAAIEG